MSSLERIQNAPIPDKAGQSCSWYSAPTAAAALALFNALVQRRKREGMASALVIVDSPTELEQWQALLALYSAGEDNFAINLFSDYEVLPYDHFSPHPDLCSNRLRTLYEIQRQDFGVCITTAATLAMRLLPREYLNRNSLLLRAGQTLDLDELRGTLLQAGYQHRDTVFEHGEFTVRGAILDLFPMGSALPLRIELFDDEVESLRSFDPETQRSLEKLEEITILPGSEVAMDEDAVNCFRDQWHQEFDQDPFICPVYQDTLNGIPSPGIEAYLPMFYHSTETLFDYLPESTLLVSSHTINEAIEEFHREVQERFEQQSIDPTRPLLKPARLYLSREDFGQRLGHYPRIEWRADEGDGENPERGIFAIGCSPNPPVTVEEHSTRPFAALEALVHDEQASTHALLCVESAGRREILVEKLGEQGIHAEPVLDWNAFLEHCSGGDRLVAVTVAPIQRGACLAALGVHLVAEAEIYGGHRRNSSRRSSATRAVPMEHSIQSLVELRTGAAIVHIDHGVGRYLGLEHMPIDAGDGSIVDAEFLSLEYAGGDRLYVPVTSLHLISRYMGGEDSAAPLSRLGNDNWQKAKRKAVGNVRDVAAELLDLYARRKSKAGFGFDIPQPEYAQFCARFPFEETEDQQQAIEAVCADMQAPVAMDRLVCGDVGFGKTEVAMRAAFIAAANSRQTMLLVPTTLLAQQHFNSFQERFADMAVRIDTLSRFRTPAEQARVIDSFANGELDILVGTHKLIQRDIRHAALGLVIVDEEHRFGVRQKEQLKQLCANVDLLTLTATPIPRTLNMAMAGLRDLSIIATPPARRLSVKTFVHESQSSIVKEAVLRELLRGGQVFYLHNDVDSIDRAAAELADLVPEAKIAIGHGQMPERQLERVMTDFYHKRYNVLVCTTIIETGIDIPNANTIIIDRADRFGLAQLHQLRGRVGRSHHQAYAYLLIRNRRALTNDASKRLEAIEQAQDLGSGFMLATHDLEIRGAGELLGADQSGQVQNIGFTLYLDMLERAVAALKAGEEPDLDSPLSVMGEINLHLPALIPEDYLPDTHNRLMLYKRIANADSIEQLRDLQVEMIDRFGLLTDEIRNLFALMPIKFDCIALGIEKIDAGPEGGYIEFSGKTAIDPLTIVTLVQSDPDTYRMSGATRLRFSAALDETAQRISWVGALVKSLAPPARQ